jgi:hypothetical protein
MVTVGGQSGVPGCGVGNSNGCLHNGYLRNGYQYAPLPAGSLR